ncbi:acyltransferase family protein [Extensimonas sp. H3M7-6]|uniref:acyltransferase family protein n=1 Tax=Extensimonas soli TaxID=3031322 RepID=UPI0023DA8F80|nr:acyltransferase [Extensimonas sp. H3M7-6]MDF1482638.1 acyltransferase [Extensimonas sp. H3M7-6]
MKSASIAPRLQNLDAVRGIAVLMVFAYHVAMDAVTSAALSGVFWRLASIGGFGVDLFYVLSGFFITKIIVSAADLNPIPFIKARCRRIYPAYIACLVVTFFIYVEQHEVSRQVMLAAALHIVMLHNIFPGTGGIFNGVFWTLGVEFPYYLLILIAAPFLRQKNYFWPTTIFLVLLAILFRAAVFIFIPLDAMAGLGRFFVSTQVLGALDAFAIGGAAYTLSQYARRWSFGRKAALWLVSMGITLTAYTHLWHHAGNYWSEPLTAIAWRTWLATGFGCVIAASACSASPRWLRFTGLPWVGKVSFSFYLWHYPLLKSLAHGHLATPLLAQVLVLVLVVCVTSWLSWRFIEIRFHPLRHAASA